MSIALQATVPPPLAHSQATREAPGHLNPLEHPGWDSLVAAHPQSSFFHSSAWARVLHETYGHQPVDFCRFANGRLEELLPVMEVASRLTGRRGVSLPFTDCCPALGPEGRSIGPLYELAMEHGRGRGWRYLECRGSDSDWAGASPSLGFYGHEIKLRAGAQALFQHCDSAVRRGIRKGQAAGLSAEFTNRPESMRAFYALHCRTRHRHGVPPQPFRFFESIQRHVLAAGLGAVEVVQFEGRVVAAAVFFHTGSRVHYKFGASDPGFHSMRPNNLLMWEGMKRYAEAGFEVLHLGRTSLANEGLRHFKLGFGAAEERIEYRKYDFRERRFVADQDRAEGCFNTMFRCLPSPLVRLAGRLLYPHLS